MRVRTTILLVALTLGVGRVAASARAQVRPRLLIAIDTSGSLALDLDGFPTFGDGVPGPTQGVDTDCDGAANDSRIYVAKEALRNLIYAFGDIEFALARFPQYEANPASCSDARAGILSFGGNISSIECQNTGPPDYSPYVASLGNPQLNTGPAITLSDCGGQWDADPPLELPSDLIPSACRPGVGGRAPYHHYQDNRSPLVCINYIGTCPGVMINPGGGQPPFVFSNGDVLVGFSGYGWPAGRDNRAAILRWIDNRETAFDPSRTQGDYCHHSTTGDCEIRVIGRTPLAGLLGAANDYLSPIRTSDAAGTCRPYRVLLVTDGVETCATVGSAPVTAARTLAMNGIPVYVIGMAIASGDRTQLDAIATAGGTDAGDPGGDTAFFANDPVTLSAGLAEAVQESQLVELCNGVDDTCDGVIDEGFVKYCNRRMGIAVRSLCTDPGETVCDGQDDNCDGRVDEGLTNACGGCGPTAAEVCDGVDNDCDGMIDEGGCGPCVPQVEICDNLDNDCDGMVDEGVTRPCGSSVGECRVGTETCSAGRFGACTGTGPTAERCDDRDNDCDGVVDGNTRPCGMGVGACVQGAQVCAAGVFGECVGTVGPSPEVCNGIDDDCNAVADDGNPGGGGPCGGGTCGIGVLRCVRGRLVCEGGGDPAPEICDGLDNDCDGSIDEDVPDHGPCGPDMGECLPGRMTCVDGTYVCMGGVGPGDEVCDGLDDDCDGMVDEGTDDLGPCGNDVGVCEQGMRRCIGGRQSCQDEVLPGREACNCEDDDCDGETDEPPQEGVPICPEGSACVSCQCALPCGSGEFPCPAGKHCEEMAGGRYCIGALCDNATCAAETVVRDGRVVCSPGAGVPPCTCRGNDCSYPCDGVVCGEGSACRPSDGRCVERTCVDFGCPLDGQLCWQAQCQPDRCASISCPEACRDGDCFRSCAGIECAPGTSCHNGSCMADPCGGVSCEQGQTCDRASGSCIDERCRGRSCGLGQACDPATGLCADDPCVVLRCPSEQICVRGECMLGQGVAAPAQRVIVTGGGGGVCDAAAGRRRDPAWWESLALLGLVVAVRRRRRLLD